MTTDGHRAHVATIRNGLQDTTVKATDPLRPSRKEGPRRPALWLGALLTVLLLMVPLTGILSPGRTLGPSRHALGISMRSGDDNGGRGALFAADLEGSQGRVSPPKGAMESQANPGAKKGGLAGFWQSVRETGFARRVAKIGSWVAGGARLLWSIPKAVIQGDSRSLIEAIGDLLSGATGEAPQEPAEVDAPDPDPSGEPTGRRLQLEEESGLD